MLDLLSRHFGEICLRPAAQRRQLRPCRSRRRPPRPGWTVMSTPSRSSVGVPQSVLSHNDRCLVARILPDGTRKRAMLFSGFLSHYLIHDRYGRPARATTRARSKGWSAGRGEPSWFRCRASPPGRTSTPGSRRSAAGARRRSCGAMARRSARGSRGTWRRWRTCRPRPSTPATRPPGGSARRRWCATRPTTTRCRSPTATATSGCAATSTEVVIGCGGEIVARHPRCYDREDMVFDPVHYLPLLEKKIGAWIRRRRWPNGTCRPSSRPCAG